MNIPNLNERKRGQNEARSSVPNKKQKLDATVVYTADKEIKSMRIIYSSSIIHPKSLVCMIFLYCRISPHS